MEILLDGNRILNKEILFESLKLQINSEEFYGNNLDSLWDVLSNHVDNLLITIVNQEKLMIELGDYSLELLKLFNDLNENNKGVTVIVK